MQKRELGEKKRIEARYAEEALRVSSMFPDGILTPSEKPDFLLHTGQEGRLGSKSRSCVRKGERALAGRLTKIPDRAKQQYLKLADAQSVDVIIVFCREENVSVNDLISSLVKFVHSHQHEKGRNFETDLPDCYCCIGIFEPHRTGAGQWRSFISSNAIATPKALLDDCISEKMERLPIYRLAATEVWLLIVNDHFLGPGEVRTDPDDLARWTFCSGFDKVLLFLRSAGGGGEVIQLRQV